MFISLRRFTNYIETFIKLIKAYSNGVNVILADEMGLGEWMSYNLYLYLYLSFDTMFVQARLYKLSVFQVG